MTSRGAFIHELALCETDHIGAGTRVWAFAHILPGAQVGTNCNVCDGVFIENDVVVGNDVTIKCGVQLWDGIRIGNGVFVGPNATFTNDRFPRSKVYPESFAHTVVENGASIGANATILPGVRIGRGAMVGAGAVVAKDVPPHAVVVGNPGVVSNFQTTSFVNAEAATPGAITKLGVGGCEVRTFLSHKDKRGTLAPIEFARDLPFTPQRTFMVTASSSNEVRGQHAHKACEQLLIAASGALAVVADDGHQRIEVLLDSPTQGLYLPPMIWGTQYKFAPGTTLLVFASHSYEDADYIRDYAEFLQAASGSRNE